MAMYSDVQPNANSQRSHFAIYITTITATNLSLSLSRFNSTLCQYSDNISIRDEFVISIPWICMSILFYKISIYQITYSIRNLIMKPSWLWSGWVCVGRCGKSVDFPSTPRETSLFELGFVTLFTFNFLSLILMGILG